PRGRGFQSDKQGDRKPAARLAPPRHPHGAPGARSRAQNYRTKTARCAPAIRLPNYNARRLKRNQDFLKDKSSGTQSLSGRKGAFQRPENEWSVECKRRMFIAERGRQVKSIAGIRRCSVGAPTLELNSLASLDR